LGLEETPDAISRKMSRGRSFRDISVRPDGSHPTDPLPGFVHAPRSA
jgi:hypothetical protein